MENIDLSEVNATYEELQKMCVHCGSAAKNFSINKAEVEHLKGVLKTILADLKLEEKTKCKTNIEAEDRAYSRPEYTQHLDKIRDASIEEGRFRSERDYYQNMIDIKRSYFSLLKDMLKVK